MISLYYPENSLLHKIAAGPKIIALLLLGTALFQTENIAIIAVVTGSILALYALAKVPFKIAFGQMKPALYLLGLIFIAQIFITDIETAAFVVLRFAALILAASLVTLTTMMSHMIAAIEKPLSLFSHWIPVEKISLALSLAIRFIPVIGTITEEVREAQRVRGMERNIFAVAMPVVIRTLKMGTEVAEALDARSFGAEDDEKTDKL